MPGAERERLLAAHTPNDGYTKVNGAVPQAAGQNTNIGGNMLHTGTLFQAALEVMKPALEALAKTAL